MSTFEIRERNTLNPIATASKAALHYSETSLNVYLSCATERFVVDSAVAHRYVVRLPMSLMLMFVEYT